MSNDPPNDPAETDELGRVTITLAVSVPSKLLAAADPGSGHRTLADAALHLADETPNDALALLLGAALQAACEDRGERVIVAMSAAVVTLKAIQASRALGVIA